jgi:starch synthase
MPPDSVSVVLAAASGPYQKTLGASLLKAGMLRRLFDFSPWLDIHIQEPDQDGHLQRIKRFPAYKFSMRVAWAVWRRLPMPIRPAPPVTLNVWLADRLLANWVLPATIFHGCTGSCLASLRSAKRQGAITLVENASRHPRQWKRIDAEECRNFAVDGRNSTGNLPEHLLRRLEAEFDACDRIVVPSTVARQSFSEMGYASKVDVVPLGVDAEFFAPKPLTLEDKPVEALFRVCYVGRVELAKGLGYLLQAWKRLAFPRAELTLVGDVKPQMMSLLQTYADPSVRLMGFRPKPDVARWYGESNLFVSPSPNEGLAQVLLEAMASGLPVVATDMSGAMDCIENGKE